jgi:hypothetical protein
MKRVKSHKLKTAIKKWNMAAHLVKERNNKTHQPYMMEAQ